MWLSSVLVPYCSEFDISSCSKVQSVGIITKYCMCAIDDVCFTTQEKNPEVDSEPAGSTMPNDVPLLSGDQVTVASE